MTDKQFDKIHDDLMAIYVAILVAMVTISTILIMRLL